MPRKRRPASRDDYDSAWKEAIGRYLREFLALLFPAACEQIDWNRPPEQLDTELRKVIRGAATGDQRADLLFRVYLLDGSERFVLAHVEVQATKDRQLADRLRELLRLVDWLMQLPAEQAIIYEEGLEALEAEHRMSYIPSFARKHWDAGIAKGQADLLASLLEKRFGPLPSAVTAMLGKAEGDTVQQWGLRLLDARNLDEVFGKPLGTEPKSRRQRAAVSHT